MSARHRKTSKNRHGRIETEKYFKNFYQQSAHPIPTLQSMGFIEVDKPFPSQSLNEELVKKYSKERQFPTVKNDCPTSKTSKRVYIKNLLNELERDNKQIRDNIYKAMSHVKPDYLLPLK